jgi:hypothetical protein
MARSAQQAMKQRVTSALFDYWNALRGERPAPDRDDIEAGAIRPCLAYTFILTLDPQSGHPFRIAGTALCEMFGVELTGTPFNDLWMDSSAPEQPGIPDLISTIAREQIGVVAGASGHGANAQQSLDLEMILLPLTSGAFGTSRILGALVPTSAPYWLGTKPLRALRVSDFRFTKARGHGHLPSGTRVIRGSGFAIYTAPSNSTF